jgi:hypothetical protein
MCLECILNGAATSQKKKIELVDQVFAIISHGLWQKGFGGASDIIGKQISGQLGNNYSHWCDARHFCIPSR